MFVCYRASEMSEILVNNWKSGTCYMYVAMYGMYDSHMGDFFLLKTRLFRLDPTFFWYYSIKQVLLEPWAPNCEIIPAKCLFFNSQKVTANGYYGIENLYQMQFQNFVIFLWLLNAARWLSGVTGSQRGKILNRRKSPLLVRSWDM